MDDYAPHDRLPIKAKDAFPGDYVRGVRIRHIRTTIDRSGAELRVVLEDFRTATMQHDTLIQHQAIPWQGYLQAPANEWDIANSDPRPKECPGCRLKNGEWPTPNHENWIFREGGMRTHSPCGGINYDQYYAGTWECTNCGYRQLPKRVRDHPLNT